MRDLVSAAQATSLDLPSYDADFYQAVTSVDGPIYKTERIQHFVEPGHASWEAFAKGEWSEALRLAAEPQPELVEFFDQLRGLGSELRRLRVVQLPLTPYLQWELNHLRYRVAAGEKVRVLDASALAVLEAEQGALPELMILGSRIVYEVCYDASGAATGARKITEPTTVMRCLTEVTRLYEQAEELESFFVRSVKPLPPPNL